MKRLSEKLTCYVLRCGVISESSYALYQYGFQIGMEMLCCCIVSACIAIYLNMISEFFVFTTIFIFLRTYAGGLHLNSFRACFICSVSVQTMTLIIEMHFHFSLMVSSIVIAISSITILKNTPVESTYRELDDIEKEHCRKITVRVIASIWIFSLLCLMGKRMNVVAMVALTMLVVAVSQYLGKLKYKFEIRNRHVQ